MSNCLNVYTLEEKDNFFFDKKLRDREHYLSFAFILEKGIDITAKRFVLYFGGFLSSHSSLPLLTMTLGYVSYT